MTWDEVADADPGALAFTPEQVLDRVVDYGDLLAGLLTPGPLVPVDIPF